MAKNLPAMRETRVWSLGQEDLLEKQVATHLQVTHKYIKKSRLTKAKLSNLCRIISLVAREENSSPKSFTMVDSLSGSETHIPSLKGTRLGYLLVGFDWVTQFSQASALFYRNNPVTIFLLVFLFVTHRLFYNGTLFLPLSRILLFPGWKSCFTWNV